MNTADVAALIHAGEGTSTELKSAREPPHGGSVRKAVAALANTGGGVIVYGVEDDGTVTGSATAPPATGCSAWWRMPCGMSPPR